MATAKKNRELQVKNYHARCAAEDAAEQAEKAEKEAADKNAAEKESAEDDANVKNTAKETAAEGAAADTTDNHDQSISSSSTAGRSVHFPEATRDAAHVTAHDATNDAPREQTAPKKSFRKVVGAMTTGFQRFSRNREEGRREQGQFEQGQRRNGIQLRNLFKKKYTGPPMEYYM
ncbi:hypothetical protein CPLU01_16072 [Colletotrichum plurivorum]|uniref:Uncharacterized protein n=1 Tax=Colletotrichum plurivorum TaxID=2175906 RepID=A0A8H6MPJ6_9PEZI|nr:hypothetical protein CPLU01_16072 [Colletotrichum plurivorum]